VNSAHENLQGAADVMAAAERLTTLGLASDDPDARGLNADGMRTLADLLSVLVFQTGGGRSKGERVASATGRAMLSTLGDLFGEMAGQRPDPAQTPRLLREALRTAKQ
jgi:hypothetical protein